MDRVLKVGELAKLVGVSVRTLHFYEEIGLLSPSDLTGSGYRLCGSDEIIRLQQITSLRSSTGVHSQASQNTLVHLQGSGLLAQNGKRRLSCRRNGLTNVADTSGPKPKAAHPSAR